MSKNKKSKKSKNSNVKTVASGELENAQASLNGEVVTSDDATMPVSEEKNAVQPNAEQNEQASLQNSLKKGSIAEEKAEKKKKKDAKENNKTKKTNDKKKDKKEKGKLKRKAKETFSELKKVSWPSFGEVCKKTGVVLVVVLVFAVVIFGIDYCLGLLVNLIRA